MNLILFVLSLILVLSAMSYARLDSFLKSRFHAKEWSWIMQESERDLYNRKQTFCNKKKKPEEKKGPSDAPTESKGSGRISLSWFFKKEFREKNPALFLQTKELAQDLVKNAWGNQPFYKDLEKEKPDFVSLMFEEIIQLADRASEKDSKAKLTHLEDLIYLPWSDLQLKTAFGRMLQEGLIYNKKGRELKKGDDMGLSQRGYQSLKDYFSSRETQKIRLFLAPTPLVKTLVPDTWEEVIKTREELYKEATKKDGAPSLDELSARFEDAFSDKTPYPEIIDYKVTKTNIIGR